MEERLKPKELQIVRHLRANARETLTHLSKKTGVPVSTLFDKLNQYRTNLIVRHTCLLDYTKLGFDLRVQLLIKIPRERERFEKYIVEHYQVNCVFRINNGFDYLIEAIFKNMRDFTDFMQALDKFPIKERKEFYVLQDLRREAFLTSDTHVALLQESEPQAVRAR
jgi:DNA-binding Lrp family transcriptional regulator